MERNEVVLIDTSSWIEALRASGKISIRERVKSLMIDGTAAWCDMVTVELWNGARGHSEKKKLAELEKEIICLPTTKEVWDLARLLAKECRSAGKTVPTTDMIITSCALYHKALIEHCDEHIDVVLKVYGQRKQR